MQSADELQQQEITALQSIYGEDFLLCPPPKVWKGAAHLPEFVIKVAHPEPAHASKIFVHLHIKLPKTYPTIAYPAFTIQQPIKGMANDLITNLSNAIHSEAQKLKGFEMVFQIVTFAQDWLGAHTKPVVEAPGSLAHAMLERAAEAEREKFAREEAAALEASLAAEKAAEALHAQLRADQQRQQIERERTRRARRRTITEGPPRYRNGNGAAHSDDDEATEGNAERDADEGDDEGEYEGEGQGRAQATRAAWAAAGDTPTESFGTAIELAGIRFNTVKMFHPRKEWFGTTYLADPVCDDIHATLPLELYETLFDTPYYATAQGRKKLRQLEAELQRLVGVRHAHLLSVHAIKLAIPQPHSGTAATESGGAGPARLVILCEQRPSSTLQDVLADCDNLREDRAAEYLRQMLSALQAVHSADLVHRGLSAHCIGLANQDDASRPKVVKIGKVGYFVRILALHRSNPISMNISLPAEPKVPEPWLPKEVVDSPLSYTRGRDIHDVGTVLLQMLLGGDVVDRFHDPQTALRMSSVSPFMQQVALNMIAPTKKHAVTCASLLADLAEGSFHRSPTITFTGPKTPIPEHLASSPPDRDYFHMASPQRSRTTHSRWKEDWEELELLGRGAFGSVVKARNKIDSRIYAVKKIKLRATQTKKDDKIFREVNTLSRLNHRFIVRYFTTWVETSEPASAIPSDSDTDESADRTADGTSIPSRSRRAGHDDDGESSNDMLRINLDDLGSGSHSSFPSIHFTDADPNRAGSSSEEELSSEGDYDGIDYEAIVMALSRRVPEKQKPPPVARTLYIQMEFVERQTLQERIAEGLTELDAWKLFHQIVDALVHMSNLGILHRDIKLTNIFIDGQGDCKVGDFGLATSSLAAVDPSDVSLTVPTTSTDAADMTLEVGTRLYIAPEVQVPRGGPRNHTKADMYSLGIVFFEMNFFFSTGAERIAVIENLRKPEIVFPEGWNPQLSRQRKIIESLLQHDPIKRPSALELSQNPLLPPRLEDEYFRGALKMISKPDSPHFQSVLSSLFSQPPRASRGFLYDLEVDVPEHASLNGVVQGRLVEIFHLHGAVDMEPPLLLPTQTHDEGEKVTFLDKHGDIVTLPDNGFLPLARLAARRESSRIKRYHIGDVYRANVTPGHPRVSKTAVFDIITPDMTHGPAAATAEAIAVVNECLNAFPSLGESCEVRVSHAKIVEVALNRIPAELRNDIMDILKQTKSTPSQKRAMMLKKGLLRSVADELEILSEMDEDVDLLLGKIERLSPTLYSLIGPLVHEITCTLQYATALGVARPIFLHPLMLNKSSHFKDGVCFEVVRRKKRTDVVATGGRYDSLINSLGPPKLPSSAPICAVGVQITLERITAALAAFQSTSVKTLIKEQRSFGFWSPRRCDVYVASYQTGHLQERLEVAAMLWQHGISADVLYESALGDPEQEAAVDVCIREGILFTVYPKPKNARRDQPAFKVKSVLKGTEYEVSRLDLVSWLHHHIAEQKRVDASTSGVSSLSEPTLTSPIGKDMATSSDVQLILPVDSKKQRKQTKQLFFDRAFDMGAQLKAAAQSSLQVLAVDVPSATFDALTRNSAWVADDDAWKTVAAGFPSGQPGYAAQVREAASKRKADGHRFVILFAVRDERVGLLTF